MSASGILLLVAAIAGLLAAILVPLIVLLRRRARRAREQLAVDLAAEPPLRGPEKAVYRGGTGDYPKVNGNGMIALTQRRLLFRIMVGTSLDIALGAITGIREATSFRRSVVGGQVHLIVETATGEVGFFVGDNAAWVAAITSAVPALRG
jgi:hypothetical protein